MLTESVAIIPGFTSYFAFSRMRSGYSGVATYCRTRATPGQAEAGLCHHTGDITPGLDLVQEEFTNEEMRSLDTEGRAVITRHRVVQEEESGSVTRHLVVINVYCPRADPEKPERAKYQQQFYKALDIRANCLRESGDFVIVCGDINTSHKEIDHCDPYEEFEDKPGRRFLSHFLQDNSKDGVSTDDIEEDGDSECNSDDWVTTNVEIKNRQFLDTFRIFHPDRQLAFTCWNTKMNCRSTNYGTRIDYIFANVGMSSCLLDCDIQPEVLGSDHCPVLATFQLSPQPPDKPPPICTKYFKEFSGKQVKLSNFFTKTEKPSESRSNHSVPAKKPKIESKQKITSFFLSQTPKTPTPVTKSSEVSTVKSEMKSKRDKDGEVDNNNAKAAWGSIFRPPPPAPQCSKHKEEAVKRKVAKKGPNTGREFWCCARGEGRADDPEARCDFFKWVR